MHEPPAPSTARLMRAMGSVFDAAVTTVGNPKGKPLPLPLPLPDGVTLTLARHFSNSFTIEARRDGSNQREVGEVRVEEVTRDSDFWWRCWSTRQKVEKMAKKRNLRALYVARSYLDPDLRNTGLGLAMYASAIAVAARDYHAVLMANNCASGRTKTSDEADRVWSSRRLEGMAYVLKQVAYPKPKPDVTPETRGNPRRRHDDAKKLPKGFVTLEMPAGTDLWRGSANPDDWSESWQWFTDDTFAARGYMEGRDYEWGIVSFDTKRPLTLVSLGTYKDLDRLAARLGVRDYDGDPHDVAPAVCEIDGVDGWFIKEGDHDGADILLCAPDAIRPVAGVDQSDDWDWTEWPGY